MAFVVLMVGVVMEVGSEEGVEMFILELMWLILFLPLSLNS